MAALTEVPIMQEIARLLGIPESELGQTEVPLLMNIRTGIAALILAVEEGGGGGGTEVVRQIVTVAPKTDTASGTNAGASFAVAYSGSITTLSATSRVLVICAAQIGVAAGYQGFARLEKAGTPLVQGDTASNRIRTFVGARVDAQNRDMISTSLVASDAPGAIGTIQYDLALSVETGGTWYLNRGQADLDADYIARGATTMFLVEYEPPA